MKLVSDSFAKGMAQSRMQCIIEKHLPLRGDGVIGHPGGDEFLPIYSNGDGHLWCAFGEVKEGDGSAPRRWNAFGVFGESLSAQNIVVEVNIPTTGNDGRVAGFFAEDDSDGTVYLMHSGKIGGGKPGVGQVEFVEWMKNEEGWLLFDVSSPGNESRKGYRIGAVDSDDLPSQIWNYVQLVRQFKTR